MELFNADCLTKMKDFSDNSIDIVIADLPYGRTHLKWDIPIDLNKMWRELDRICKETTPIFLFGDMAFGVQLINSNPKDFKWELVWTKPVTTTPLLSRRRPGKATEYVFVFYRKQCVYNYHKYHTGIINNNKTKTEEEWCNAGPCPTHKKKAKVIGGTPMMVVRTQYTPRLPLNFISGESVRKGKIIKNITEKPQFLLEFLLKYFSNPNDVCLDFCMGSGSCGVACSKLERKFIGIEINKEHFFKAKERLIML